MNEATTTAEGPETPPEGVLIKRALVTSGLTQREAARRAQISESRWRQIVAGHQVVGGHKATFVSRGTTLARMAQVVSVTPEQLADVGRVDAAEALRAIESKKRDEAAATVSAEVSADRVDERWRIVEAALRQALDGLAPPERSSFAAHLKDFSAAIDV